MSVPALTTMSAGNLGLEAGAPSTTKSVSKALAVLNVLRGSRTPLGVTEIARRVGMPKTTAFRCLAVLESHRFVDRVGTDYQLSWRLFEFGATVRRDRYQGLHDTALPYLCELLSHTQLAVQLAVLENSDVILLESIGGLRSVRTPFRAGSRLPATCTALGKAILAFSDVKTIDSILSNPLRRATPNSLSDQTALADQIRRARADGFAQERDEAVVGLSSVAAPIIAADGRAIAAIATVSGSAQTTPPQTVGLLRSTAAEISRRIARWPSSPKRLSTGV